MSLQKEIYFNYFIFLNIIKIFGKNNFTNNNNSIDKIIAYTNWAYLQTIYTNYFDTTNQTLTNLLIDQFNLPILPIGKKIAYSNHAYP